MTFRQAAAAMGVAPATAHWWWHRYAVALPAERASLWTSPAAFTGGTVVADGAASDVEGRRLVGGKREIERAYIGEAALDGRVKSSDRVDRAAACVVGDLYAGAEGRIGIEKRVWGASIRSGVLAASVRAARSRSKPTLACSPRVPSRAGNDRPRESGRSPRSKARSSFGTPQAPLTCNTTTPNDSHNRLTHERGPASSRCGG